MADDKKTETPEDIAYRRTAIASQLRYVAGKVEQGSLTGFSLVWDGQTTIVAGDAITDIGRTLEMIILAQRDEIQRQQEAIARAQNALGAKKPPVGEGSSNLN